MHGRSTRPTDTADPAPGAGAATTRPPRRTAAPARGVPVGKPARAGDTVLILVVRLRRGREGARGAALTDGLFFCSFPRAPQYRGFFDILEARRARLARGEPPLGTPRKAVVELPAGEGRGGGAAQYLEAEVLTWTYVDALEDAGRHFAMELPDFGDDGGRGGEEEEEAGGGAATRPMPVDW